MMNLEKINIVGSGPSGLYFAILMRENFPESEITIFERNRVDDLSGWGIVIIQGTVRLLEKCDPHSYQEIVNQSKRWSDVEIRHNGVLIEEGFRNFHGKSLVILGGGDVEAAKFKQLIKRSPKLSSRTDDSDFEIYDLPGADHTFSTRQWRDQVIAWTKEWVASY